MDSFVNRGNVKGLVQLMDQNKIKGIRNVEDKFFNEEKIQKYEEMMNQIDAKLEQLDNEAEELTSQEPSQVSKQATDPPITLLSDKQSSEKEEKQTIFKSIVEAPMRIDQQIENILNRQIINKPAPQVQPLNQTRHTIAQSESKIINSGNQAQLFEKDEILEEIQDLVETLTNEGIKEKDLPHFSRNTSYKDLKMVKMQLMKKWKKLYSRGIIEDVILMVVKGLEGIFDGKTCVLGFSPNLSGFSNTVMMGVKQHRSEMSKVIENACVAHGIGVRDKFLIKIVTSAIKRNILNKATNNSENHSQHMRSILQNRN